MHVRLHPLCGARRRFDFSQAQIPAIRRRLCHDLLRLKFDADV